MTDDSGQVLLWNAARELTARLLVCEAALRPRGSIQQMQHNEFAWRVRLLGMCLDSALRAATAHEYPAALALLRTAVEHRVFDRLLFLASRHVQVIEGVSDEVWERWQTQRPEFLLEWERLSKDRVRAVWRGARVVDEKGQFLHYLSVYYKWWKEYNPLIAPDRDAAKLASGHPESPTARSAYARTQRDMWRDVLAWKNLKESLLLNELASETEVLQLDVHHRFLSAYAHPFTEDMSRDRFRRNADRVLLAAWPATVLVRPREGGEPARLRRIGGATRCGSTSCDPPNAKARDNGGRRDSLLPGPSPPPRAAARRLLRAHDERFVVVALATRRRTLSVVANVRLIRRLAAKTRGSMVESRAGSTRSKPSSG